MNIKKYKIIFIKLLIYVFENFKIKIQKIILILKFYKSSINSKVYLQIDDINNLQIGAKTYIGAYTCLFVRDYHGKNSVLHIGENTYIGEFNNIRASDGDIFIGNNCLISQHISIISSNHNIYKSGQINDSGVDEIKNGVEIEDNVWIGANSIILPGVKICNGSVIGAGSVITKNVPPNSIIFGNPGRIKSLRY